MRISDWSSDVCSSDLGWRMSCAYVLVIPSDYRALDKRSPMIASCRRFWFTFGGRGIAMHGAFKFVAILGVGFSLASHTPLTAFPASTVADRKRGGKGIGGALRLDIGGQGSI